MTNITSDRTVDFTDQEKDCPFCEDGQHYVYTKDCPTCDGQRYFLRGTRRYKCKECKGDGYVFLPNRINDGTCRRCNGTQKTSLNEYDNIIYEDREWIFQNLFNFEKSYTGGASTFNEGYLGLGIVCGVTDYGRYQKLTPEEFREEVQKYFMDGWLQYVSILNPITKKLPDEILIRKGSTGWFAYPIYKKENA